ncbi:PH domain-containing protein [Streptomyces sp. NPDC005438]|uniref:PH domain-containing protein n=1 Tax=Streptomyces sp. NPDC005438 TaxID=3156880 RepID=UPI0033A13921
MHGADGADYADHVYRSTNGMVGGVLLLLLVCWLGLDTLFRTGGMTGLTAAAGMVCFGSLIIAFTLRPAVFAGRERLLVRNPFRTVRIPWGTVEEVRAGYTNEVYTDDGKYQLWSVPVSLRARRKAARRNERSVASDARPSSGIGRGTGLFGLGPPGNPDDHGPSRAPGDRAVDRMRELADTYGEESTGEVHVRWAYEVLAPFVVGGLLLVVLMAT